MDNDDVEVILRSNMRNSPDPKVNRRVVHAFDAITQALPPVISITSPPDGATLSSVSPTTFRANIFTDGKPAPTVSWRLADNTLLGTGNPISVVPPLGQQTVRAVATFRDGTVVVDSVRVNVPNFAPTVQVTAPRDPNATPTFGLAELIQFKAISHDDAGPLADSQIRWHLDGSATSFATGHTITANTGAAPGPHTITVVGCDIYNVCTSDSVQIVITPDTPNQPPVVQITNPANGALLWVNGSDADGAYHELTLESTVVDPDGDPLTLVWLDNNVQIATGPSPTVRLRAPCGNWGHRVTLVVTDTAGNVRQDAVDVTVGFLC